MKIQEMRRKSEGELEVLLNKKREELRRARLDVATHKTKNVNSIDLLKKEIARILTLLREK